MLRLFGAKKLSLSETVFVLAPFEGAAAAAVATATAARAVMVFFMGRCPNACGR
jgi:hypothetical protein